jgi:CelD/BcsL family acetyltransferase involved in cellulose biosynthesis
MLDARAEDAGDTTFQNVYRTCQRTFRMTEVSLEAVGTLDDVAGEWKELAERSGNVFSTWEWASTWWRHFGDGRRLLLMVCRRDGGGAFAILPLYFSSSRPVRTIRFIGHGPADQLGPVCDPQDRQVAAGLLKRALDERCPPWDIFIGEQLNAKENWRSLLGGTSLRRNSSLVLRVEGRTWEEFLASRTSNFRGQVRRRERKLAREHELRFRLTDSDRLEEDLETLFRLHELRHEAFAGGRKSFHREFAAVALARGWLRLWIMEVSDRPVAAWYGFRFGNAECFYQSGRDPAWDEYSVGFVLLAHSIREAFNDGVGEYRLLRGRESYKDRFSSEDHGLETIGLSRTPAGKASILAAVAARSIPRPARRLLARLAG